MPRVSPYRLAAHLSSAFVIYSGLLWTTLNLFYPLSATAQAPALAASGAAALRKAAHPLAALIGITAVSGRHPQHVLKQHGMTWLFQAKKPVRQHATTMNANA